MIPILSLCLAAAFGAEWQPACEREPVYQDRNAFRPDTVVVRSVSGKAVFDGSSLEGVCVALFSESDHQLLAKTTTDSQGKFRFEDVKPGAYRLVALAEGFCPANAPVRIAGWPRGGFFKARELVIHLKVEAIDVCSWVAYR